MRIAAIISFWVLLMRIGNAQSPTFDGGKPLAGSGFTTGTLYLSVEAVDKGGTGTLQVGDTLGVLSGEKPKIDYSDKRASDLLEISIVYKLLIPTNAKKKIMTLDEAWEAIRISVLGMVAGPSNSFEYNGVFYLSGGNGVWPERGFRNGYFIRKGDSNIYMFYEMDGQSGQRADFKMRHKGK